jgi:transposase
VETPATHPNEALLEQLLARITHLEAALAQRDGIIREQADALKHAQQENALLQQEIARLQNGGPKKPPPPPDWVKPNSQAATPHGSRPARKKRQHNATFHRLPTTKPDVEHACECCGQCGHKLSGGWEYSRRQVVEIPPVTAEVTDHVLIARRCGVCGKVCVAEADWTRLTGGSGHYGVRLVSLVAYLRTLGRLPKQTIAAVLSALYGLKVSVGAITGLLHRVAQQGKPDYEELGKQIRGSPYVHADETGWRENGQNGYLWSFSTPVVRYFTYDKSRSHTVPEGVLTEAFRGVLVSDFYSGYHYYPGLHQRCWVHLFRDLRELKQKHPTEAVLAWVAKIRALYDRAKAFCSPDKKARRVARLNFQAELLELAVPYVDTGLPQSVLAARMVRFEAELFTFVEYPEVPSENNAAERSVRPRVIARKISGGTRSSQGSQTMAVLASLFETWRLRGEDALEACRQMLMTPPKPAPASASAPAS